MFYTFPRMGAKMSLHLASSEVPINLVQIPERGADIHARSKYGLTPLHCASSGGHRMLVEEFGADVNAKNRDGRKPLHFASESRYFHPHGAVVPDLASLRGDTDMVMRMLVEYGVDLNATTVRSTPDCKAR